MRRELKKSIFFDRIRMSEGEGYRNQLFLHPTKYDRVKYVIKIKNNNSKDKSDNIWWEQFNFSDGIVEDLYPIEDWAADRWHDEILLGNKESDLESNTINKLEAYTFEDPPIQRIKLK